MSVTVICGRSKTWRRSTTVTGRLARPAPHRSQQPGSWRSSRSGLATCADLRVTQDYAFPGHFVNTSIENRQSCIVGSRVRPAGSEAARPEPLRLLRVVASPGHGQWGKARSSISTIVLTDYLYIAILDLRASRRSAYSKAQGGQIRGPKINGSRDGASPSHPLRRDAAPKRRRRPMLTATHSRASGPSRAIAEHIAQIDRGQIPQAALYGAKQSILDTVGVMIAATGLVPAATDLSALICELGGRPTSTVLGFGYQTSPPSAAFVNGGMAHCLDYDDFHAIGFHPSAPTVPAGLAVAESRSLSGADLLTAVAIANDVGIRLCQAVPNALECGWYTTPMLGNISAAAVAALLLALDTAGHESHLRVSSIQAGGTLHNRLATRNPVAADSSP